MKPRDFTIRLAGRYSDNPVDGLLGIDDCFWPVRAEIVPLRGTLELKKVEIEVVVYEYGEIRITSTTQNSRDINVEKILYHRRVVAFDGSKDNKHGTSYRRISEPLSVFYSFSVPAHLPGAIKCHKDPASVVWKLNIAVSRNKSNVFTHDPHVESYEYSGPRSFLPHTLTTRQYILDGRDDKKGVAWTIDFPRSFFAGGECLSGRLTLQQLPGARNRFSIRTLQFELAEYVFTRATNVPLFGDVHEYRGSRSLIKTKLVIQQSFSNDGALTIGLPMCIPQDCAPGYSGPHIFIMHRVVIKTKSKHGVEFELLTQFPLRIVSVPLEERVRLTAGKQSPTESAPEFFSPAPAYVEKLVHDVDLKLDPLSSFQIR